MNILAMLLTVALGVGCPLVPRPQSFNAVEEKYILADDVVLDYMIFPRIAALAETEWTEKENKDLNNFDERLKKQFHSTARS